MVRCVVPSIGRTTPRDRLRDCWSRLDWLAEQSRNWDHPQRGEEALEELRGAHGSALEELVASGELGAAVAQEIEVAFEAATFHIWRANGPVTCYEPVLVDYFPTSAGQLVQQSELLCEMAQSQQIDPDTVALAQAAIERDLAFLTLSEGERQTLYQELQAAAGDTYQFPTLDELGLEVTPEAAEAARFLVDLLLGWQSD
jgi:hypothetical protein